MPSEIVTVLSNRKIEEDVWEMSLSSPTPARPGQFYMLRRQGSAHLLPRAISLCTRQGDKLIFLYKVVGAGTGELSAMDAGDALRLTGPLGNGWPLEELMGKRVLLVGGGIGIAPLLFAAQALSEAGNSADCCLGFPHTPFYQGEFAPFCPGLQIATESGAAGYKGLVTALFNPADYDAVLCCGPTPMMKAVTALCQGRGTPVWVSLENRMACGIGACLVCTCADQSGKNRRTCKDGPVFRGEEINFDA